VKIDAHIHYRCAEPPAVAVLDEEDVKTFNICVAAYDPGSDERTRAWREQAEDYRRFSQARPDRYAWCASFDLPRPDENPAAYADKAIASLERDFADGALACKVWKNIGMEAKKADGSWLQIDDPIFTPIFESLERMGKPLLMHIGEPLACWQPIVEGRPHAGYYKANPQWHMHGKEGVLHHRDHIRARDNVVERHPGLKIVGAHFGSLEYDLDEVVKRLDRYPNFAVDTSARMWDAACQDSGKVRDFFARYRDQVLWGTDFVYPAGAKDCAAAVARYRDALHRDFQYLESDEPMEFNGTPTRGLALDSETLDALYRKSARRWYPGL